MRKKVIEIRKYSDFPTAFSSLNAIRKAGFHADLNCIAPEPKGIGICIGDYYELFIFVWEKEEDKQ